MLEGKKMFAGDTGNFHIQCLTCNEMGELLLCSLGSLAQENWGAQQMDRTCSVKHMKHLLLSGVATQLNKNGNVSKPLNLL